MKNHFPETPAGAKTLGPVLSDDITDTFDVVDTRDGFLEGRFGTWTTSLKALKVFPETSLCGLKVNPLYHGMLVDSSIKLSLSPSKSTYTQTFF